MKIFVFKGKFLEGPDKHKRKGGAPLIVIPAKAGIQVVNKLLKMVWGLDPGFRRDDGLLKFFNFIFNRTNMRRYIWLAVLLGILSVPRGGEAAQTVAQSESYTHYIKALIYESQGNFLSAQMEIEKAIALEPNSSRLYRSYAETSFYLGQLKRAREAIEKANELNPDNTKGHLLAGQIYWSLGDIDEAEKKLRRAVELSPDDSEPLISLATALTTKNPEKAAQLYKKFLELHPGEVEIMERLGQIYRSQGNLEPSRETWEKVLEWSPDSVRAHLALAQIAEVDKDTATAVNHYESVLNKDPTNLPLLLRVGELQYRNNEMAEAYEAFSRAKGVAPESASANFWMALLHEHKGEWEEAIERLQQVAGRSPETGIMLRLSYYHTQAGHHKEAIHILSDLSEAEPENIDFLNYLAIAYEQNHQFPKAVKTLNKLIEIDTFNAERHFHLATLFDRMGKFTRAEASLEKSLELKPDFAMALNYLGYSYADQNVKLEKAETLVAKAVTLEPERSAYLDSLGWVYYRQKRYKEAEKILLSAAEKGNDPLIWEHLGDVREAQKKYAEAILAYEKSLRFEIQNKAVAKKIKRVIKKMPGEDLFDVWVIQSKNQYSAINTWEGLVQIKVCQGKKCFESPGQFTYVRAESLKIEIAGPLAGPLLLVSKKFGKPTKFGALHPLFLAAEAFVTEAVDHLDAILSAEFFEVFVNHKTSVRLAGQGGNLSGRAQERALSFKKTSGQIKKVEWNQEGKTQSLVFKKYLTGAWPEIPSVLLWENSNSPLRMKIEFKKPLLKITPPSLVNE